MNSSIFLSALLLSLFSFNVFAGSVACRASNESMMKAVVALNSFLDGRLSYEISRPVFHESTSADGIKTYLACVSLVK